MLWSSAFLLGGHDQRLHGEGASDLRFRLVALFEDKNITVAFPDGCSPERHGTHRSFMRRPARKRCAAAGGKLACSLSTANIFTGFFSILSPFERFLLPGRKPRGGAHIRKTG